MPELPEVETIVAQLSPRLSNRKITRTIVKDSKPLTSVSPSRFRRTITGKTIKAISRHGKFIILTLTGLRLLIHLRMTGNLILDTCRKSPPWERIIFELDDGTCLVFRDIRRLGRIYLETAGQRSLIDDLGPDALMPEFDKNYLRRALKGRKLDIKSFLLDQRKVAGIGNIYAAEILHRVGIHPERPCSTIGSGETAKIVKATKEVLKEAISQRGTTISAYRDAEDRAGRFQAILQVYGREGEPCFCCGRRIRRLVQKGRSTFFCPQCQQ